MQLLLAASNFLGTISSLLVMCTNQCFLHRLVACLFAFLSLVSYVSTQSITLASNGLSLTLSDIPYYVSPYAAGNITVNANALSKSASVNGFYPVTIVQGTVSSNELPDLVTNFTSSDDVFQTAFTQGMLQDLSTSHWIFSLLLRFSYLSRCSRLTFVVKLGGTVDGRLTGSQRYSRRKLLRQGPFIPSFRSTRRPFPQDRTFWRPAPELSTCLTGSTRTLPVPSPSL
jgi:hypothetical protein